MKETLAGPMADSQSPDRSALCVVCPAVLDLAYAPELRDLLLRALSDGGHVELDAIAVTHVDTANLQVICAAARDLQHAGRRLRVAQASPALIRTAERLGLVEILELGQQTGQAAPPPGPHTTGTGAQGASMARIMAVDDSTSLRRMLVHTLKEGGHQITEAQDGVVLGDGSVAFILDVAGLTKIAKEKDIGGQLAPHKLSAAGRSGADAAA